MPKPSRILIIDDEPHMRSYFGLLARMTLGGPEILEAGDEAAGLARYAEARPDLVLLDVNLIGASGLDILVRLLQLDPGANVVMLTAVSLRRFIEEAHAKGAKGYILKDSGEEEVGAALLEVVGEIFGPEAPSAQP